MEKVIIEIVNPEEKTEQKFHAAVEALAKALKVTAPREHAEGHSEPTPYPALQGLTNMLRFQVEAGLRGLFEAIIKTWFRKEVTKSLPYFESFSKGLFDERFELNGQTYINPSTGQALTKAEWEAMARDLDGAFGYLFGENEHSLTMRAMALGKILQGMPVEDQVTKDWSSLQDQVDKTAAELEEDKTYKNMMDFADVHTGELIQDLSTSSRKAIVSTIIDAQKNRLTAKETEDRLFEEFSTLNRDWRRIAETETATNFNNGYLIAESKTRVSSGDVVFMRGISGAGACPFCASHVKGKVFVLLDEAPSGADDTVLVDGKSYTAIWPGKTNYGRKASNWWVSAGTQHVHCKCSFTRFKPGMQKYYDMLDDAMDKQAKEAQV